MSKIEEFNDANRLNKVKRFIKNVSPLNNRTEMPMILYVIKVVIIFWFVKFESEIIGEGLVLLLHFACDKNPLQGEMFDSVTITLITYFGYGLMVGIAILYWRLFQKKPLAQLGFPKKAGTYFAGAIFGVILCLASVALIMLTGAITFHGVFDKIDHGFILLMLGGFICQGAFEEVLCRGIVQQLLVGRTPTPVAVGVSTALFVIPHVTNMEGVSAGIFFFAIVDLILISLIFSFLTLRYESIWAACGLHSIWNFILYHIFGLNLSGNDEVTAAVFDLRSAGYSVLNGGAYGVEASVITAAVLAAFLVVCYASRKEKNKERRG